MNAPTLATLVLMSLIPPATAATAWHSCSGPDVADAAVELLPCSNRPNCISTAHPDPARRLMPPPGLALEAVRHAALAEPRSQLMAEGPGWFIVHFRSWLFGFVDEAHFIQRPDGPLAVRSGACSGYWDFGVNRRRLQRIFDGAAGAQGLE